MAICRRTLFRRAIPPVVGGVMGLSALEAWRQYNKYRLANHFVHEIELVQESKIDHSASVGFEELRKNDKSLDTIRMSVGFVWPLDTDKTHAKPGNVLGKNVGSAVLLDQSGTLVLCGHEVLKTQKFAFVGFINPRTHMQYILGGTIVATNDEQDIAFMSISPEAIAKCGLIPVKWGQLDKNDGSGEKVTFVGTQNFGMIHAMQGEIEHYKKQVVVEGHTISCKIESKGNLLPGMSGGGAFVNGKFVGVINSGSFIYDVPAEFTPVEDIKKAYLGLFPDRSAKAGITDSFPAIENYAQRPECSFDRRQFFMFSSSANRQ